MKRALTVAFVLSVALTISILPGSLRVLGQDSVAGTVTGVQVSVDGTWIHNAAASGDDGNVDTMVFTDQSGNFVLNAGTTRVDYVLGILPAGSRTIDIDVGATYAVRAVTYNNATYGLFSVVVDDAVQSVIAPPDDFAATLRSARNNIRVDDSTVFFGVDADVLARLLPDDEGASIPLIRSTLFTSATPVPVDATVAAGPEHATPVVLASESTIEPGQNAYDAPWSGMRVIWNNDWQIGVANGRLQVSTSLEGYQFDEICLESARQLQGVSVCISVYQAGAMDNADVWRNNYASATARSRFGTPYYHVSVTEHSVTFAEIDVQGETATVSHSEITGGHRVTVTLTGSPEDLVGLVEQARLGVQLDGQPVLERVDIEQLRVDTEAAIASVPEYQAVRDTYLTGLGMVDATHYTSAALGCDVQWSSPLALDGLSTTMPIEQGESYITQPAITNERFTLLATDGSSDPIPIKVECLQHLGSADAWVPWVEAIQSPSTPSYVTLEGAWAYYVVDSTGSLSIAVKPLGGPAVVVTIPAGPNGLRSTMDTMTPGTLVINGVDVFRVFENDGVAGLLP